MKSVKKAVGGFLGGVTGGAILAVLGLFGWAIEPEVAAAVAVLCATLGTYLAPKNAPA